MDLPGHGDSAWPGAFELEDVAESILDLAPPVADYVGWSLGGVASLACALRAPGRVRSVAILAMSNFGGERAVRMRDSLRRDRNRALAEFYRVVWSPADRAQPHFETLQRELARVRRLPSVEAMAGIYDAFLRGIPGLALERVSCPVVVGHGTADGVSPLERAREVAARIPGAHVEPVDGAGHVPFLTFPAECRAILRRFWDRPTGAR